MKISELCEIIDHINSHRLRKFFGEKRYSELSQLNYKEKRKRELEMIEDMRDSVKKIKVELSDPKVIQSIQKLLEKYDLNQHQYGTLERKLSMDMILNDILTRNSAEDEIFKRGKK